MVINKIYWHLKAPYKNHSCDKTYLINIGSKGKPNNFVFKTLTIMVMSYLC